MADGNAADWTLPLRFTNTDYTLQYSITNDKNDLYVCVLSRDEARNGHGRGLGLRMNGMPVGGRHDNGGNTDNLPIREDAGRHQFRLATPR